MLPGVFSVKLGVGAADVFFLENSNSAALVPGTEVAAPVTSPAKIEFMATKSRRLGLPEDQSRSSLSFWPESLGLSTSLRLRFSPDKFASTSSKYPDESSSNPLRACKFVASDHRCRPNLCVLEFKSIDDCKRKEIVPGGKNASHMTVDILVVMSREMPSLDSIATNPRKKRPAILSEHRHTDRILDFSSEAMPRILAFYTVAMDHDNTAAD